MPEKIIVACTRAAMMLEELSAKAVVVAAIEPNELERFVRALRDDLEATLHVLEGN